MHRLFCVRGCLLERELQEEMMLLPYFSYRIAQFSSYWKG